MVNNALKTIAFGALDYLAPQRCIYCDQRSHLSEAICEVCRDALCPNDDSCPRCALPRVGGRLCQSCLQKPPLLHSITAAYEYDAALAYFMHRWKYLKEQRLAITAAKIILKAPICFEKLDLLLATPLHWRRELRRGFNQSEDLLRALCLLQPSIEATPSKRARLSRRRSTPSQAHATRSERLSNLKEAFAVHGDVLGLSVGIVDDVCTTAATGNAMASALLKAGAAEVHLYCLARTPAR
ncbi:double zinc ribbon domain-containing protein [Congregibacter variabilis]|uniref:Double zinc ribbon domain-containing protein n=1 Tax=Congregibacter variabilis TaxID=3081200 RepID=A0ABZ0I1G1_9GAMM|nr:double zinc ribbon domain-containing protein [Congregibacter sp. IMCC43200]